MPWIPAHYSLIEKLKKSQISGSAPTLNGKAFWFAYLWEECGEPGFLSPVKEAVARLFNHLFELPPQWDQTQAGCGFTITGRGTVSFKPRVKAEQVYLSIDTPLTLRAANAWDGAADADLLAVMNQL